MESPDPDDWQLPLSQLLVDSDQPSTSTWCTRDEVGPSECHIQPQTELDNLQFSLPVLQLENTTLIIVLKSEPTLSGSYQMVFERCFENKIEEQIVSCISGDGDHCFWLQEPLNLLIRE